MVSFRILFLIGVCLTLQEAVLADPITTSQPVSEEDSCKNVSIVAKKSFLECVKGHFLPDNETRMMYNESRCPLCTHLCTRSDPILKCVKDILDVGMTCNKNLQGVGREFYHGLLESAVTFFCENGGDRLTTIDDIDNMRCVASKEGNCSVDVMDYQSYRENEIENEDSSSSESVGITEEIACRRITNGLICASTKAESCNEETATVISSFADYIKKSSPCSKFYVE